MLFSQVCYFKANFFLYSVYRNNEAISGCERSVIVSC